MTATAGGDPPGRPAAFELVRVRLPLARPFATAHGTEHHKQAVLVRALGADGAEGWGECSALARPTYTGEWTGGAWTVLRDELGPAALAGAASGVRGHPMAAAAVEAALADLDLRRRGQSLAAALGAPAARVPCGVAVGVAASVDELLAEVAGHVAAGYRRVKLKVRPGWDLEPTAAVRAAWPDLALGVDGNAAYGRGDADHLARFDALGLVEVEQPLPADDLVGLAALARRLATPICLDESIGSARQLEAAIALGAGAVVNVKPARVGGVAEALRVLEVAAGAGLGAWIGGMLETGVAKAVSLAVAARPEVTEPGDLTASSRWFAPDLTAPFEVGADGCMAVPDGPGIGVAPAADRVAAAAVERLLLRP